MEQFFVNVCPTGHEMELTDETVLLFDENARSSVLLHDSADETKRCKGQLMWVNK